MPYDWVARSSVGWTDAAGWRTNNFESDYATLEEAVEAIMKNYRELRTIFLYATLNETENTYVCCDTHPGSGWPGTKTRIGRYGPSEAREILLTYARML